MQIKQQTTAHSPQLCVVSLLGNLVAKPDIRYRANPISALTEITLATSTKWLDKQTNQYKEWTSYHHVKVEGEQVEQALLQAEKGDIILINGYLASDKSTHKPIVCASFTQRFTKGYTQAINQIHCSGQLSSSPQLMTTTHNKTLVEVEITISHQVYCSLKQIWQTILVKRPLHIWGKQAQYLYDNAKIGDQLVVEGRLSYTSNADKSLFIEASKVHLLH